MKIVTNPLLWLVMKIQRKPLLVGLALLAVVAFESFPIAVYAVLYAVTRPFGISPDKLGAITANLQKPFVKWGLAALAFGIRSPGIGWLIVAWNLREALLPAKSK